MEMRWGPQAGALVAAFLWGINYPVCKGVLGDIPEGQFLVIRYVGATALLLPWILRGHRKLGDLPGGYRRLALLGLLGVGVYNLLWTWGIHRTSAASAALILATSPLWGALGAWAARTDRLTARHGAGLLLGLAGLACIGAGARRIAPGALEGDLILLAGSGLFAYYSVGAKPLMARLSPLETLASSLAWGLPVLLPLGLGLCPPGAWVLPSSLTATGLAYVVLGGTVGAYALWYRGIHGAGPVRTVTLLYLVPVLTLVAEPALLGTPPGPWELAGALAVLGALLLPRVSLPGR